ncbi:MAG: acetyl-CoA carboxylase carboxyltransferase subunit beta [Actinomycetota bacterium]|nr:acetyl-CoA carboxylase carboxyltransferase subunit beta [Actinomycetota bacterium]
MALERERLQFRLGVCPNCGHHHRMGVEERAAYLFDSGSFKPQGRELRSSDPLDFGSGEYLREARALGREAMVYGTGKIAGKPCVAALMDFTSFGGSMGAVAGEIYCRACELSMEKRLPLLVVTTSGGARMQEGTPALLQMAKTMAALQVMSEEGIPSISLLCDPTCGGVTASFATAADVILAEPGALICFSGPRVVEQTTGMRLPPGFCSAESLFERGFVDMVVPRSGQRRILQGLIGFLSPEEVIE